MKNPATHGFSVPTTCSLTDRRTGIDRTSLGHRLNKPRAHTANTVGNKCPNWKPTFGHYTFIFQQAFKKTS